MNKVRTTITCLLIFTGVIALGGPLVGQTGTVYELRNDIPVTVNGQPLRAAWAGGLTSPQFSSVDLDQDGFPDLVVFDRVDQTLLTFINGGTAGQVDFTFAPEFISAFPPDLTDWMLMADFDRDGYEDIFTALPGTSNIRVFRNTTAGNGGALSFSLYDSTLYSDYQPYIPLYSARSDLPAIIDVDEDGDLDILTFHVAGRDIEWHRNMSMENYGDLLHLEFFVQSHCFGHVQEDVASCAMVIEVPPCNPGERLADAGEFERNGLHSGSTLLALDLNADSLKELLVGDVDCASVTGLLNSGTLEVAHFSYQENDFPSNNTPIEIPLFPATFYLDMDNDGVRDLVAAPNRTYSIEDVRGVSMHKNIGADAAPSFQFEGYGLMQDEMIETGSSAVPFFFDWDGDGLQDLLIGNLGRWDSLLSQQSYLQLFRNTGTAQQPAFTLQDADFLGLLGNPLLGPDEYLVPAMADLDGDGDDDMLLGKADGGLLYFRNDASPGGTANFVFVTDSYAGIDAGLYSAPELYDLDQDGDFDLLLGNHQGRVQYYANTGNSSAASFTKLTDSLGGIKINDFTGQPFSNGFAKPRIADVDGNGQPELLVGTIEGHVKVFGGLSDSPGAVFTDLGDLFQRDFGGYVSVAAAVLDSSRLSYVVGTRRGGLMLMRSTGVVGAEPVSETPRIEMKVWPNPAQHQATVSIEGLAGRNALYLELYDLTGRPVRTMPLRGGRPATLDLEGLAAGMYLLLLQGDEVLSSARLLVTD